MKPRDHWNALAESGCTLKDWADSGCIGPIQLHHCGGGSMLERGVLKGKGTKNSDWLAIPLCYYHHLGGHGIHSLGVRTWETLYGAQAHWLDLLCEDLQIDLWAKAKEE